MAHLYLLSAAAEIQRRRQLVQSGHVVEAWPDLYTRGQFWIGETSKALLDGVGPPLPVVLSLEGAHVPVYYGPRLQDVESLPLEESLQARVLSARGIAVAWITVDIFGARTAHVPTGPTDPIFFLRRPAGRAAHVWRLFRNCREARAYMAEFFGLDREAQAWAEGLSAESFDQLVDRHAVRGSEPEP